MSFVQRHFAYICLLECKRKRHEEI